MCAATPGRCPACRWPNAAPMPAWRRQRQWPICSAWVSPRCACCQCSRRWTSRGWRNSVSRTTGATTRSAFSAPTRVWRPLKRRAKSSARWCVRCTLPASKCCSTSSTTTPPKATSAAPRCRGAVSTTPAGTAWPTVTKTATRTGAAAATRSTRATRACCRWCSTACASGCARWASTASASTWRRCSAAAPRAATAASTATARSSSHCCKTRCCSASS